MATPKGKKSKAKTRSRRANHDRMTLLATVICDNCGADRMPHRICGSCGFYKNRPVLNVEDNFDHAVDAFE